MRTIRFGHDPRTKAKVNLPIDSLRRHFHLQGATGTGKTTALLRLLHGIFLATLYGCLIIDLLGGFSWDLLMWFASRFCPQHVRDRLIYFEAAREDWVLPFNPLPHESPSHGFYRVMRAVEVILRGWESQNIEAMPRLSRWIFNAFWAAAQLGLTISDCAHFLMPTSPLHGRLIALLPESAQLEWSEITHGRPGDVAKILESVRNRLKPFLENEILRRMFGSSKNQLDVMQFMRDRKILLVNLAPQNRLSPQVADAIGGLIINELQAGVRSLPAGYTLPVWCILDEFQNFIGEDFEYGIPELRQKGVRLICAHQSQSQLVRGEIDLRGVVFQLQNRLTFGMHGEDADVAAHELASLTYDPNRIKEELYSRKQRISGHRIVELQSWSETTGDSESNGTTNGSSSGGGRSRSATDGDFSDATTYSWNDGSSSSSQFGTTRSQSQTSGRSQSLVPVYEEYLELSSRNYVSFQEQESIWGKDLRRLPVGLALLKVADKPEPQLVQIDRSTPGFLGFDMDKIRRHFPWAIEQTHQLIEENFARGPFCSPDEIDRDAQLRLERVLHSGLVIPASVTGRTTEPAPDQSPFA